MIFVIFAGIMFHVISPPSVPTLNVYNWYAMMPQSVLDQFYEETGIRVSIDFYDSNEMLEAKLLSGNSGYDIVFPSASPYLGNQIQAGVYQKIDKNRLKHYSNIEPILMNQMRVIDPDNLYGVPYYWGTLGFAYDEEKITACMVDAPVDSYAMLFDPNVVKNFSKCGVTLLEESVDVYPLVLLYLGYDMKSANSDVLQRAHKHLMKLRPAIRRFSSSRLVGELLNGETCLAQAWSGDTQMAIRGAAKMGRKIRYVIPKEGTLLWIDAIAIPKDAPHPDYAHQFIDFLLRPDITAKVSMKALLAPPTQNSHAFLPDDFKKDQSLFPPRDVMEKLQLDAVQPAKYERLRNRLWTNFRLKRKEGE